MSITQSCVLYLFSLQNSKLFILFPHFGRYHGSTLISASLSGYDNFIFNISNQKMYSNYINFKLFSSLTRKLLPRLPALHQKFDLPAPFVLHTDCPHYWRYHLPGESEEEFSTRLANNLENLILKEGPETVI